MLLCILPFSISWLKLFLDLRGWYLKIKSHACHAWLHCYFILLLLLFLHLIANVHLFRSSPNCMLLFSKENSRIWQESAILDEVKNKELICFFFKCSLSFCFCSAIWLNSYCSRADCYHSSEKLMIQKKK